MFPKKYQFRSSCSSVESRYRIPCKSTLNKRLRIVKLSDEVWDMYTLNRLNMKKTEAQKTDSINDLAITEERRRGVHMAISSFLELWQCLQNKRIFAIGLRDQGRRKHLKLGGTTLRGHVLP